MTSKACVPKQSVCLATVPAVTAGDSSWKKYLEVIYPDSDVSSLDVNAFSWFYNTALFRDAHGTPVCLQVTKLNATNTSVPADTEGMPWVGSDMGTPEAFFSDIGFFVMRPMITPSAVKSSRYLEVIRTGYGEKGVAWFYHAVGSGIFLDTKQLPTEGSIVAVPDRKDLAASTVPWSDDSAAAYGYMFGNNIKLIAFTSAFYHPRTEIIVRLSQADESSASACPNVKLWKGIPPKVTPCACADIPDPHTFLNCGFAAWSPTTVSPPDCRPSFDLTSNLDPPGFSHAQILLIATASIILVSLLVFLIHSGSAARSC